MTADDTESVQQEWVPLAVSEDPARREAFLAVREGVPAGAQRSLVDWCDSMYSRRGRETRNQLFKRFETAANRRLDDYVFEYTGRWAFELSSDDGLLLDAIHYALQWSDASERAALSDILRNGRSIYRVGQGADDRWELQKTYSNQMIDLVETTAARPGRAGEHLRIAWSGIAGRQPDPDKACWEATKAVEVAAKPIIAPNDDTTHLSKMLGEMKANPDRWEIDLTPDASIERIMGMMRLVLQEGRRHGDENKPIGVTPEAAEIVVQTAVVLVHWFESGFVRRVSS